MVFVRKVIKLNRSMCVVLPVECAKYIDVKKGSYVTLKRVDLKNTQGVMIEKLSTTAKREDLRDVEGEER